MTQTLPWNEVLVRVGLACLAGGLLGVERESHGRAAGLRTTVLACVAAAVAMILSEEFFLESRTAGWSPDPARLAAGVLTGMGFLGGGTILRQGNSIRGVTTAAVLWFVTILGLTFGSGHIWLGILGFGIALILLEIVPLLENRIPTDWYGTVTVTVSLQGVSIPEIRRCIEERGVRVKKINFDYDLQKQIRTLQCDLKFKKNLLESKPEEIVHCLIEKPGVLQVKWE